MNSLEIKHALMWYYRFKRQYLCATECLNNDVMVIDKKNFVYDVEVKISKYDLWKGEAKKSKHKWHKLGKGGCNKFYICVPEKLREEAFKWVESVNNNYGVIICTETSFYPYDLWICKNAKLLNNKIYKYIQKQIMMRVCSENIGLIGRILNKDK